MLNAFILQLETIIKEYGAIGLLVASFFQEIIAPIPSSLIAMFAGFFLIPIESTWTNVIITILFKISIIIIILVTIRSLLIYVITYLGGKPFIEQYSKWFGMKWTLIKK